MTNRQTGALLFAAAVASIPAMASAQEASVYPTGDLVPYFAQMPPGCRVIGGTGFRCTVPLRRSLPLKFHTRNTREVCSLYLENHGTPAMPRFVLTYSTPIDHKCHHSWTTPTSAQVRW